MQRGLVLAGRIYVIVGVDAIDAIDELFSMAEELGIKVHLVISPYRLGGLIVEGMLVKNIDELPGRLVEAYVFNMNVDGLILACCG